jgi:hypothetical protein
VLCLRLSRRLTSPVIDPAKTFVVDSGIRGRIWHTDGTPEGTRLLLSGS